MHELSFLKDHLSVSSLLGNKDERYVAFSAILSLPLSQILEECATDYASAIIHGNSIYKIATRHQWKIAEKKTDSIVSTSLIF